MEDLDKMVRRSEEGKSRSENRLMNGGRLGQNATELNDILNSRLN